MVPNMDWVWNYIAYYANEAEGVELLEFPVVYRRGAFHAAAVRVAVGVNVGQRWLALPLAVREWQGCEQCRIRRGGASCYWIDDHWTQEAAVDLTLTREEVLAEFATRWPEGILQAPQTAHEQAVLLTTM